MELSKMFDMNSELVTHIGIFDDSSPPSQDLMLYEKSHLRETRCIESVNFVSSPELVRKYKCKKCNVKREIENIVGEQTDIIAKFLLPNKAEGILKSIGRDMEDMMELGIPIIFVNISRDVCSILGFTWINSEIDKMNADQLEQLHYTGNLMIEYIHNHLRQMSKYSIKVFASIFDRISGDEISMPGDFLIMSKGILSNPVPILFSSKITLEMSMKRDTEFICFRDKENLLITVKEGEEERLIRLPFSELIDSNGKIKSSRINTVVNRNLAIARNRESISTSSFKTQLLRGLTKPVSNVGMAIKLTTLGGEFSEKGGTYLYEEESLKYAKLIPQLLHLLFAKYCKTPDLWNDYEIRRIEEKNRLVSTKSGSKHSRLLHWGSDNIRYIRIGKDSPMAKHWVNSHVRITPLKNKETIQKYRKKKWPIYRKDAMTFGGTLVIAHVRGKNSESNWDGEYNFGKKSRGPYSQMAISWIQSIERKEGVIIQHAESGGELRIPLGKSCIHLDGWCEETNTAYEFHGDVWHGNPEIYGPEEHCHPFNKEWTAGELYEKTILREQEIRNLGFNLVTIWEFDWKKTR